MRILYQDPFAMMDEEKRSALNLLSGKRINIHAVERVDGASTAARLVREAAEQFGAIHVDLSQRELNQDVFVSIHNGTRLPFQFWVGAGERSVSEISHPRISLVQESNHEELTARILMSICYFLQMKEAGTPLPELSSTELNAATRKDSGCFVATVCMGSIDHQDVIELRRFRDQFLDGNPFGRLFIKLYYRFGPYAASWLYKHECSRLIIRKALIIPLAKQVRLLKNRTK